MGTTLTPPIHAGKSYSVRFTNDNGSTGVVLVTAGWVPKHGNTVPGTQSMSVAPSAESSLGGVVPALADVRRLSVTVSLEAGESGTLELLEDAASIKDDDISETTTWEVPVDP